jgi:hypothetical protein
MRIEQTRWIEATGWEPAAPGTLVELPQVVFVFGSPRVLSDPRWLTDLRRAYPLAQLFGCSTAGEICGTQVTDDALVVTAVRFDRTRAVPVSMRITDASESRQVGRALAGALTADGLKHVLVLSDGLHVNGSALVDGLRDALPESVGVTGGLSGDGDRFRETLVIANGVPATKAVAALGLYGSAIHVGCGSLGGWDPFGPERVITRAEGNVLYTLDDNRALDLYKEYLGRHAAGLPATALLFPLSVRSTEGADAVVRTVLSVDESAGTMTFAGDIPQGAIARLMRANFDRLIDGAAGAARASHLPLAGNAAELALLISCVGRKLVLGQRVEEEVEGVREVLGQTAVLTGFYSYGEISPFTPSARCELHNQTMTITTLTERWTA